MRCWVGTACAGSVIGALQNLSLWTRLLGLGKVPVGDG